MDLVWRAFLIVAVLLGLLFGLAWWLPADAWEQNAPAQYGTLFNSRSVSAADTAVSITVTAAVNEHGHVYGISAFCSAGTATLSLTDGGTTVWGTSTGFVGTTTVGVAWTPAPYTGPANSALVVSLSTCGAANTGTLNVQADRYR